MKVLCVAEKPSVARTIADILSAGGSTSLPGRDKFCRNFSFPYRLAANHSLPGVGAGSIDVVVTSVRGHLTHSDFPADFRDWRRCRPDSLLTAPIVTNIADDYKKIGQNLSEQVRQASLLLIWTDCDREGEHIGAEIVHHCRKSTRNIAIKRARFSAIIREQIHRAMQHPVELDWNAVAAVECRMELDLRLGSSFTRLQTMQLQDTFAELKGKVISYGPCQFPTLGFVVEKYCEVMNFVPEPFWYIYVMHKRDGMQVEFRWARNHLFVEQEVKTIFERCKQNPTANVKSVQKKQTRKFKPQPLTTVELQKAGGNLLKLAPKRVLDIAEKLYQQGILSYPRTETDQFDAAFDFRSCIDKQRGNADYGAFASQLLDGHGTFEKPIDGKKNDQAHPPIHPTRGATNLTGDEKRVFDYITQRFLASCSKHAIGEQTEVKLDIARETFTANGVVVLERNYLEVFPFDTWGGPALPKFDEDEHFKPTKMEMKEGETTRPKLLTEAALVGLMDKNGIGTDATIAEHIQKIIDREYVMIHVEGKVKYLVPSTLGVALVEGHNSIKLRGDKSLCKPDMRREIEEKMTLICQGTKSKEEVLRECLDEYGAALTKIETEMPRLVSSVRRYVKGEQGGAAAATAVTEPDRDQRQHRVSNGDVSRPSEQPLRTLRPNRQIEVIDLDSDDDFDDPGEHKPSGRPDARAERTVRAEAGTSHSRPRDGIASVQTSASATTTTQSVQCHCEIDARQHSVRKEGANQGRQFWSCARQQDDVDRCTFFEWADNKTNGHANGTMTTNEERRGAPDVEVRRCECDLEAIRLVTNKAGDRQGHAFWKCPNISKKAQCSFFVWEADEAEHGGPSNVTTRVTNGNNNNNNNNGGGGGGQACYNCGQSGHWASACTSASSSSSSSSKRVNTAGRARNANTGNSRTATQSGDCFSCGQSGHWTRDCPDRQVAKNVGGRSDTTTKGNCYNCGNQGHWSNQCPEQRGGGGGESEEGAGRGKTRQRASTAASRGGSRKRRRT